MRPECAAGVSTGTDADEPHREETLDRFLRDSASSALTPADTKSPMIMNPGDYWPGRFAADQGGSDTAR
ncbi:hypothetical protein AOQ72_26355 [Bradyrhizobium yuanmingense]|uniref:Uncharacterized protein n=1 Tax=Bradyrhizobium yuanmingense TaxID=108015 RepID=A0A0R3C623_9BRAD|nr:hypothetical protein AOQ72_26355 [Bradyrhizobium yuanmingense]